jgi:hypothetical protein
LIGNDENCIQGNFYDATVSKMAANKIGKLLMVSDFNENQNNPRYQFSLKSENIEILPILSAAIFEMAAIRSQLFLVRIFYQPYLIYMPSLVVQNDVTMETEVPK